MEQEVHPYQAGKVLLIDKPLTWTSFQVVKLIRSRLKYVEGLKKIKVGHAGTLDPLATGLLVIATGRMTKKIPELMAEEKRYTGEIYIGATRASYDKETEMENEVSVDHITDEAIEAARKKFLGEFSQLPPIFSAVKVDGKRAYKSAREGKEVELKPRLVTIKTFELTRASEHILKFDLTCSKGTYIRSLAHDIGETLDCGAYLESLRRESVGEFSVEEAIHPKSFLDPDFKED